MFHDQLQNYLRQVDSLRSESDDSRWLDVSALRKLLLARLRQLPAQQNVNGLHESWSPRIEGLANFLRREIPASLSVAETRKLVRQIFEEALPIRGAKSNDSVDALEARRLLKTFEWEGHDIARYAIENRLTRLDARLLPERTLLATTLLRLSGRDAIRWLLIIESERSTGRASDWNVHRSVLEDLLERIDERWNPESGELYWDCSEKTLNRLARMGVAERWSTEDEGDHFQIVSPAIKELTRELLADDPWRAAVRAALADETQRVVPGGSETSLAATTELSRIVTHEVRNALVPVRHHATTLLSAAQQHEEKDRVEKVLRGVNRVLRFVEELVTISEAVTPERLKTKLGDFLHELVAPLDGGAERVVLDFVEQQLPLPREPLARAVRNVVQNALQLTQPSVSVELRAAVDGDDLVIVVDDAGSGVPVDLRERIFEEGFTTREGGTGFGLAMARRILSQLGGSIRCEASPLGGARFVLALPITEHTK